MSFAILFEREGFADPHWIERHVPLGQTSFPTFVRNEPEKIIAVQADGHELSYIINHFSYVPWSNATPVNKWRGDLARFIFENLPYSPEKE